MLRIFVHMSGLNHILAFILLFACSVANIPIKKLVNVELSIVGKNNKSRYVDAKSLEYRISFQGIKEAPFQLGVTIPDGQKEIMQKNPVDKEKCSLFNGKIVSVVISDCFRSDERTKIKGFARIMQCNSYNLRSGYYHLYEVKLMIDEYHVILKNIRTRQLNWRLNALNQEEADNPYNIGEYEFRSKTISNDFVLTESNYDEFCNRLRKKKEEQRYRRKVTLMQKLKNNILEQPSISPFQLAKINFPESKSSYPVYNKEMINAKEMILLSNWDEQSGPPSLAYKDMEDNVIELLIVVTERMSNYYGSRLHDYLKSVINSVSDILRKPSLKARIRIDIVDIIKLDSRYFNSKKLDDWSEFTQEEILSLFCNWVNRLRRPGYVWDSAVLLNTGRFNSSALGVAHRGSMCNPNSSCFVSLNKGFGTGHILAHEIGHQLTSSHDFDPGSDCGETEELFDEPSRNKRQVSSKVFNRLTHEPENHEYFQILKNTVMSGEIFYELYPPKWSKCSQESVSEFLKAEASLCLRHKNFDKTLYTAEDLKIFANTYNPGENFDLNEQCAMSTHVESVVHCNTSDPYKRTECRHLMCKESSGCMAPTAVWAEGTPCNNGLGRCFQGECYDNNLPKPEPINGQWGSWGPWSSCSRSCDGGVQFSQRECNNPIPKYSGEYCLGNYIRTRSCGNTPCQLPHKSNDPRQDLCDELGRKLSLRLIAYKPKFNEKTACKLICLSGQHTIPHNLTLADGVKCYDQYESICIQNECYKAGCDGILGSDKVFDNCHICGGDNSQCKQISGIYDGSFAMKPDGTSPNLVTTVKFPVGSTNIFVKKISPRKNPFSSSSYDDYALFIHDGSKIDIRRGETYEPYVGARLYYSGSMRAEEVIKITGRIDHEITLVMRKENAATKYPVPSFSYSFYLSVENEGLIAQIISDNNIMKNRSVRQSSHTFVKEQLAKMRYEWKLETTDAPCKYCSGVQTNHPRCYQITLDKDFKLEGRIVSDSLCPLNEKPSVVYKSCKEFCHYRWNKRSQYPYDLIDMRKAPCSSRCETGNTLQISFCEKLQEGQWTRTEDRSCIDAKLDPIPLMSVESCEGECLDVFWTINNFSECDGTCGEGVKQRFLSCTDTSGMIWPLTECYQEMRVSKNQTLIDELNLKLSNLTYLNNEEFQEVISKDGDFLHHLNEAIYEHAIRETCLDTDKCEGTLSWSFGEWSSCRINNSHVMDTCRGIANTTLAPGAERSLVNRNDIGVKTRKVFCVMSLINKTISTHTSMRNELCEQSLGQSELSVSVENCSDFTCYNWGPTKLSQCSVECGKGQQKGKIPCNKVTYSEENLLLETVDSSLCRSEVEDPQWLMHEPDDYVRPINLSKDDIARLGIKVVQNVNKTTEEFTVECFPRPCWIPVYQWSVGEWSECPKACTEAIQTRRVYCTMMYRPNVEIANHFPQMDESRVEIDSSICKTRINVEKPIGERACPNDSCAEWKHTTWSECHGFCNYGIQTRQVQCIGKVTQTAIKADHCPADQRPSSLQLCRMAQICPKWNVKSWSRCLTKCGTGLRRRQVACDSVTGTNLTHSPSTDINDILKREEKLWPLMDVNVEIIKDLKSNNLLPLSLECSGRQPLTEAQCLETDCSHTDAFWWPRLSKAGCESNGDCSYKKLRRDFVCIDFSNGIGPGCRLMNQPPREELCLPDECKTYNWNTGPWTKCSDNCRSDVRYRSISCVDDFGQSVHSQYCSVDSKPRDREPCPCSFTTCATIKKTVKLPKDGTYSLRRGGRYLKIYCADMNTEEPKEYINLFEENYSLSSPFVKKKNSISNDCCPLNGDSCENMVRLEQLNSKTSFHKIRINIASLTVNITDTRFAISNDNSNHLFFGTSRDCFNEEGCMLGKFEINLLGTDFRIDESTTWEGRGLPNVMIEFKSENKIIRGQCGGGCGLCLPKSDLQLVI